MVVFVFFTTLTGNSAESTIAYLDVSTRLGLGRSPFSHVTSVRDFSTRALPSPYCPQASAFSQGRVNIVMFESTPLGRGRSPFTQYFPHASTRLARRYCPQASTFCQEMMPKSKNSASEVQEVDVPDKIILQNISTILTKLVAKVDTESRLKEEDRQTLQEIDRKLTVLSEAQVRTFGANMFGASFAKRHLARKLEDLVFLVAKGKDPKFKSDDLRQNVRCCQTSCGSIGAVDRTFDCASHRSHDGGSKGRQKARACQRFGRG